MFDGYLLLAWVVGLAVVYVGFLVACGLSAEEIDGTHPDAKGSLDLREEHGPDWGDLPAVAHEQRMRDRRDRIWMDV